MDPQNQHTPVENDSARHPTEAPRRTATGGPDAPRSATPSEPAGDPTRRDSRPVSHPVEASSSKNVMTTNPSSQDCAPCATTPPTPPESALPSRAGTRTGTTPGNGRGAESNASDPTHADVRSADSRSGVTQTTGPNEGPPPRDENPAHPQSYGASSGDSLGAARQPAKDDRSGSKSDLRPPPSRVVGTPAATSGSTEFGASSRVGNPIRPSETGNVHPGQSLVPRDQESARRDLASPVFADSSRFGKPTRPGHPADIEPARVVEPTFGADGYEAS